MLEIAGSAASREDSNWLIMELSNCLLNVTLTSNYGYSDVRLVRNACSLHVFYFNGDLGS
jgi:hypothetical protein